MDHPENFSLIWSHGGNKFHSKSDQLFCHPIQTKKTAISLDTAFRYFRKIIIEKTFTIKKEYFFENIKYQIQKNKKTN